MALEEIVSLWTGRIVLFSGGATFLSWLVFLCADQCYRRIGNTVLFVEGLRRYRRELRNRKAKPSPPVEDWMINAAGRARDDDDDIRNDPNWPGF